MAHSLRARRGVEEGWGGEGGEAIRGPVLA